MADKILLQGMVFYAYMGNFSAEREVGQTIEVDLELVADLQPASQSDDDEVALSGVDLYTICKEIVEEREFMLPEAAAEAIAEQVLESFDVEQVTVRIRRPGIPLGGPIGFYQVEIKRSK